MSLKPPDFVLFEYDEYNHKNAGRRQLEMFGLLISAGVLTLLGVGFVYFAIRKFIKRSQKKSWPQTTGEIIESNVDDAEKAVASMSRYTGKYGMTLMIRYSYKVNLVPYESDRFSSEVVRENILSKDKVRAYSKLYATGNKVTVYYNPDDHSDSVLDPSVNIGDVMFLTLIGVATFLCGLSLMIVYNVGAALP
jgi:predicted membrane protein